MPWLWAAMGAVGIAGAAERPPAANSTAPGSVASVAKIRSARSFNASSRRASSGPNGARSVLATTSTSASAACRPASANRSSVSAPCYCVDQGHHPRQMQGAVEHRVGAERVEDRRRVGEPGGFDDDAAEPPDFAGFTPVEEAAQGAREILTHGAAEAPAGQFENIALDKIDEVMVDRDLADLVDDDGGVGERRGGEGAAQQRRFAAAEKTRQQRRRQGLRFGHFVNHLLRAKPARRSFHAAGAATSSASKHRQRGRVGRSPAT